MAKIKTNTELDGQITGQNPDAGGDHFLIGDYNRDVQYLLAKINEWYKFSSTDTTGDFQILYGGVVSDGGSGTIDISAGAALGKDASGNLKLVEIPALSAVALPSGWNDGRQIWVIGQHKYVTTGSTRSHDETTESYNYTMIDSYLGSVTSDNLFVDADPTGNYVIWGSFNMNGTTFTDMNVRSMQYTAEQANRFGYISGTLAFNTTALPPTVKSGERNVIGNNIKLLADKNLALADALGGVSQTFSDHTYSWQRVILDKKGKYFWVPSFDTASPILTDISVSGVVIAAGTATVSTSNTTGLLVGHMAVIKGATISGQQLILIGKVVSISAGVNFTMKTSATGTVAGTITYSAYYRITTLHGSGSATGINTDADVGKYSPSPLFCAELNGYYLDQYGIPTSTASEAVYRIIGHWFVNASSQTDTAIISYKSGFDKNDNDIFVHTYGGYGSTNTAIPYLTTPVNIRGSDTTYKTDTTNGDSIIINTSDYYTVNVSWFGTTGSTGSYIGISLNSTQLTTQIFSVTSADVMAIQGSTEGASERTDYNLSIRKYFNAGDILRVHGVPARVPTVADRCRFFVTKG